MAVETGLTDRRGRPICVGDIVQQRISDPINYQIAVQGKKVVILSVGGERQHKVGYIHQKDAEYMTVVEPAS